MKKFKTKKIISLMLVLSFLTSQIFFIKIQKVEAGYPVQEIGMNLIKSTITAAGATQSAINDHLQFTKEFILDGLAYQVARIAIQQMVSSTINWINNGFEGSPMFITDLEGFLTNVGDEVVGEYIYGSKLNFLCSPFQLDVKLALAAQYYKGKVYEPRCTLSEVTDNIDGAIDDLDRHWDWDVWNSVTQTSSNNAFGQYIESSIAMNDVIANKKNQEVAKLGWGSGFLSYENCQTGDFDDDGDATDEYCEIVTPGSMVVDMAGESISMGGKALIQADEINEIVGALLNQLTQNIMGPGGLLGSSKSSGGGASYTSKLVSDQGDTTSIISRTVDTIGGDIDKERSYLNIKQDSLNAVNGAKLKLEELKQCYTTKIIEANANRPSLRLWNIDGEYINSEIATERINSASTTITIILQPIIDRIFPQITFANNNIEVLGSIINDVQQTNDVNVLNSIIDEYRIIQISGSLHTIEDIANAEVERDGLEGGGIIGQMNTLNNTTEDQIEICESYTLRSLPTSQ